MKPRELLEHIEDTLSTHIIRIDNDFSRNWVIFTLDAEVILKAVTLLFSKLKCRFVTVTAMQVTKDFDVYYHFCQDKEGLTINLHVILPSKHPAVESIANLIQSANGIELEIHQRYGVRFLHHPGRVKQLPQDSYEHNEELETLWS